MQSKTKWTVTCLSASAAFFAMLVQHEGFRSKPYLDSVGVPTIGIGSTVYEDGRRVAITDQAVSKARAIEISRKHVQADEAVFRRSLGDVVLSTAEYDLYLDFMYQYGQGAWQRSSMRRNLLAGNHKAACRSLLKYKFAGGRDCSIRSNGCYGVWTRQLARYQKCIGANE